MPAEIHARTEWCPHCNPPIKLIRKNLSTTMARKGCPGCRQKFDFIRTDTPEGRRMRTKAWRDKPIEAAPPKQGVPQRDVPVETPKGVKQ